MLPRWNSSLPKKKESCCRNLAPDVVFVFCASACEQYCQKFDIFLACVQYCLFFVSNFLFRFYSKDVIGLCSVYITILCLKIVYTAKNLLSYALSLLLFSGSNSLLCFFTSEDKSCDVQRSVCSLCVRSFGTCGSPWTWARVSWRRSSSGSGTESDIVKILIWSL
jgi:hypothetical protein